MRNYELTLLVKPELTETQLQELLSAITSLLQDQGALIGSQDVKGKKVLPAAVAGYPSVELVVMKFTLDPKKIEEVTKGLKTQEALIRHFLLTYLPTRKARGERIMAKSAVSAPALKEEAEQAEQISNEDIDKKLAEIFKQEENL